MAGPTDEDIAKSEAMLLKYQRLNDSEFGKMQDALITAARRERHYRAIIEHPCTACDVPAGQYCKGDGLDPVLRTHVARGH